MQTTDEAAELVASEHLLDSVDRQTIVAPAHELRDIDLERHIEHDGGAPLLGGDLVDAFVHGLETAELLYEEGGRLLSDARHAGDVVRRIALEADEVGDTLRRHAEALDDRGRRVDLDVGDTAPRGHDPDVVVDELQGIAVAGHDDGADAGALGRLRERAEDVVGFVARLHEIDETESLDDLGEVRPLFREQVGHLRALCLVLDVLLVAKRLLRPVPGDDHVRGPVLGDDLEEHLAEAEQGVRREAVGRGDGVGQSKEGAEGETRTVEEVEAPAEVVRGHAPILPFRPAAAVDRPVRTPPRRPSHRMPRGPVRHTRRDDRQRSFFVSRTRVPVGPQAKRTSSAMVRMKWMPRPAACVGSGAQIGAASMPAPRSPTSTATSSG